MARFPNIQIEDVVQENDKTRIDASKSFISKDESAITIVEIEPESGGGYVAVGSPGSSKDWYLDWEYQTAGTKTVSCRVTTGAGNTVKSATLSVVTEASDYLFSNDSDLTALEHDILKYVPQGRSTFKNFHRKAQRLILAWLDENGHTDSDGERLTKSAFVDLEEVKYWSAALTMHLIYSTLSNSTDDIFSIKSKQYESMAISHRNRLILRLDADGDSTIDSHEGIKLKTLDLVRR